MKTCEAIKNNYQTAQMVCGAYLGDLTDEEAMQRPHPGCNHINWQVGHLVASENRMANSVASGSVPTLPDGFADKYTKETSTSNDVDKFVPFTELQQIAKAQSEAVVAMLDGMSDEAFDAAAPEEMQSFAPTIGAVCNMLGSHWMMHAGQWVILRRQLGREIVI